MGKTRVGGSDLNKPRIQLVAQAVIALSASPDGFTASQLAGRVRALGKDSQNQYRSCHAAYDLKKLRGKQIVRRIGQTRRYQAAPTGLRAIAALLVLRNKAIKPCREYLMSWAWRHKHREKFFAVCPISA